MQKKQICFMWVWLVCLILIFSSCAPQATTDPNATKFSIFYPEDPTVDRSFFGLQQHLDAAACSDSPAELNIVLVHGMNLGTPTDSNLSGSYAVDSIKKILLALDFDAEIQQVSEENAKKEGFLRVYEYPFILNDGKKLKFHEINYSAYLAFPDGELPYSKDLSEVNIIADKRLLYKNDLLLVENAAKGNKSYKESLVTWGIADAVTYLDQGKRRVITDHFEKVLEDISLSSQDSQTIFITESLGSKILFDSLAKLYDLDSSQENAFNPQLDILRNTQTVYMLANQIPLLELGTATENRSYAWERLFLQEDRRLSESGYRPPENLTLVAFSDPNDLLTFPIEPTLRFFTNGNTNVRAIDVEVQISKPVVRFFGVELNNPVAAHTGHLDNARVIDLLVNGYQTNFVCRD